MEPMIWLNEGENEGIADCGCRLVLDYEDENDPAGRGTAFFQCSSHAAVNKKETRK